MVVSLIINIHTMNIDIFCFFSGNGLSGRQYLIMPVKNIVLDCCGDESRIFDCPHYYSFSSTCNGKYGVSCGPGNVCPQTIVNR